MTYPIIRLATIALAGAAVLTAPAFAQVKLPPTITATAYDTGTAGFNITVAIGKMMKDKYGTDMRVLPAGNDVARLQPLRTGRAAISKLSIKVRCRGDSLSNANPAPSKPIDCTPASCASHRCGVAAAGSAGRGGR